MSTGRLTALLLLALSALTNLSTVSACDGDHSHAHGGSHDQAHYHSKRLPPSTSLTPPTRPLEWGDLNFIHTTDSHGWLLGHQKGSFPEPNYSGDLGDFASFVQHMKEIALKKDVDLLLVDSGDLHDGTGLVDGFPAGGIEGHHAIQFFKKLPYDVMAIGNHELYIYNNTLDIHKNFAPALKGRYLSSNVNITLIENGVSKEIPVGDRFTKFKTRKGKKITALGVIFHFTGNDENTTVQAPADMVKEAWFKEAIQEEPDVFLLAGHMPIALSSDWHFVFDAIRAVHPLTPIIILGGHTHIRDCVQMDRRSVSLESGRYMETVGWLSANLKQAGKDGNLTFSRRYLDPNRVSYEFHSGRSNRTYDTLQGKSITQGLLNLGKKYDLSFQFGVAPRDLHVNSVPYPSNDSSVYVFVTQAMPVALAQNNTRSNITSFIAAQGGSQRFDISAGPFDKNDQFTASPFTNGFVYIPNFPLGVAKQAVPVLNGASVTSARKRYLDEIHHGGEMYMKWMTEMHKRELEVGGLEGRDTGNLTLGYVTKDSCPGVGDDIPHTTIPTYTFPDVVSSNPPSGDNITDSTLIDFIFIDFIQPDVLEAVNSIQKDKNYTDSDVLSYSPLLLKDVWGIYAEVAWK